jgi:hypothetical protein
LAQGDECRGGDSQIVDSEGLEGQVSREVRVEPLGFQSDFDALAEEFLSDNGGLVVAEAAKKYATLATGGPSGFGIGHTSSGDGGDDAVWVDESPVAEGDQEPAGGFVL